MADKILTKKIISALNPKSSIDIASMNVMSKMDLVIKQNKILKKQEAQEAFELGRQQALAEEGRRARTVAPQSKMSSLLGQLPQATVSGGGKRKTHKFIKKSKKSSKKSKI